MHSKRLLSGKLWVRYGTASTKQNRFTRMEGCSKYQIFAAKFTKVKKEEGCMKDRVDDERNSGAGYTRKVY